MKDKRKMRNLEDKPSSQLNGVLQKNGKKVTE
jgi:hypothetical protein